MRFINVNIFLLLSIILMISCGEDLPDEAKRLKAGDYVCASVNSLSFGEYADSQTITINSNTGWRASCDSEWISLSQNSGKGNAVITVTTTTNEITSGRQGIIEIVSEDYKTNIRISISQEAAHKYLTIDTSEIIFVVNGGSATIKVNSNTSWKASLSDTSWFTLSSNSGTGNATIIVRAPANPVTTQKQATIQLLTSDNSIKLSVSVTQNGMDPILKITIGNTIFNMVRVDGGTFRMGATSEQSYYDIDERPTHYVTLSGYYCGETEVTEELWYTVMGDNPSYYRSEKPVVNVSWYDCQDFITRLNSRTGKKFRLLTEAEWEFAARGGNKSKGYKYSGSDYVGNVAWYESNSDSTTHVVGTKTKNELGIYDMSGNVWEWCQDWYGSYPSYNYTNPTGPLSGSTRVLRGGSWLYDYRGCRVSDRLDSKPDGWAVDIGFRLAL